RASCLTWYGGPHEPGTDSVDQLGHGPVGRGDDGRAAGERLDHHHPKGLGPADGIEQATGMTEQVLLVVAADLTDELDTVVEQRGHHMLEVGELLRLLQLGGDLERHARGPGHLDRGVHALLSAHAAEEDGVAAVAGAWP